MSLVANQYGPDGLNGLLLCYNHSMILYITDVPGLPPDMRREAGAAPSSVVLWRGSNSFIPEEVQAFSQKAVCLLDRWCAITSSIICTIFRLAGL